jgi:hypothetical protein
MSRPGGKVPSYCCHRASGQAVVRVKTIISGPLVAQKATRPIGDYSPNGMRHRRIAMAKRRWQLPQG